jgi:ATP-dependent Lhr-like helicase
LPKASLKSVPKKYDEYLPEALLTQEYGLRAFDVERVKQVVAGAFVV